MKAATATQRNDHDNATPSQDLSVTRIETIEDLLRKRGFFDTVERDKTAHDKEDQKVMVN
jgi:hypothetical protein